MTAVKVFSLAYMNAEIIARSFEQLYATKNPDLKIEHHVLWQHYPLDTEANYKKLQENCRILGIRLHDAGQNLGLHGGFNWLFQRLRPSPNEVVIGYDPDSFPVAPGWDMALVRAIEGSGGKTVWASLMNPRSRKDLEARGFNKGKVDGHLEVWHTKSAVTNSVCAFKYEWLMRVGFTEPRPFYGHFETEMYGKLRGKQWTFLPGYTEADHLRDLHDIEYVHWKWVHAHLKTFDGDFGQWLASGKPGLEPQAPKRLP